MQEFQLDPVIAEELLTPSFKPKVERRGETVFLILHFPSMRTLSSRPEHEIDFVVGKHFLITTRYESVDPLHIFAKALEVKTVLGRQEATHGGHLFVEMVRTLYQAVGNECDTLQQRLQTIEENIFKGNERQMVIELSQMGRILFDFREALLPHKDIIDSLEPAGARLFGASFGYHVHTLQGAYIRIAHTLQHLRDSLQEMRETNNSLLTTKQNDTMKTLTVLAFLFLPLSFVASLFGMSNIPLASTPPGFWQAAGMMLVLALSCLVYFKRKGWL